MHLSQFNPVFQLVPGRENRAKPRLAAHHVFVGFGRALQREYFSHSAMASDWKHKNPGATWERHRIGLVLAMRINQVAGDEIVLPQALGVADRQRRLPAPVRESAARR
jgi:hypothetical protein